MKRASRIGRAVALCLLALAALAACTQPKPKVKTPALLLYLEGQTLADQELYGEAVTKFQEVADQNSGTLLGSFAYLRIAEIRVAQQDWVKAETNYRLFLAGNLSTHLTPYVVYRLAYVNHEASFTGLFFPSREVDRDQTPNRQIVQEFKRFYFLYPKSIFLPEMRHFAEDAYVTLAEHERVVGDFYYRHGHYNAAAHRYLYLLRTYPDYPDSDAVLDRLILSYQRNQQPDEAAELKRLRDRRTAKASAQAPGGAAAPSAQATGGAAAPSAQATGGAAAPSAQATGGAAAPSAQATGGAAAPPASSGSGTAQR
jgi:outer membrane protein assembly factor BamD